MCSISRSCSCAHLRRTPINRLSLGMPRSLPVPLPCSGNDRVAAQPTSERVLDERASSALLDTSAARSARLADLSTERLEEARATGSTGERAKTCCFEAGYLILAATVSLAETSSTLRRGHPCSRIAGVAARGLGLSKDDQYIAETMSELYAHGGWDTLEFDAILEWCMRVRHAYILHCIFR